MGGLALLAALHVLDGFTGIAPKTKIMTAFILAIAFFGIVLVDRGADNDK